MGEVYWDREKGIKKKEQNNKRRRGIRKSKDSKKVMDGWGIFKGED